MSSSSSNPHPDPPLSTPVPPTGPASAINASPPTSLSSTASDELEDLSRALQEGLVVSIKPAAEEPAKAEQDEEKAVQEKDAEEEEKEGQRPNEETKTTQSEEPAASASFSAAAPAPLITTWTSALSDLSVLESTAPEALVQLAHWIREGQCRRILVLSGAGVSVAAGIPDFRTPGTGLYDRVAQYGLPYPEAIFDVRFYQRQPAPFCTLAQQIWPGWHHAPTLTHVFVALLAQQGLLLRNYTQNIDGLEYWARIPEDLLVECHGHFRTASCPKCRTPAALEQVQRTILEQATAPNCTECGSYVKPDIVFFGESLPDRFHRLLAQDQRQADCLLILGTSLQVAPVSLIPDMVPRSCKRVLLNRQDVGGLKWRRRDGQSPAKHRDWFHPGDCDDSITTLAQLLGWHEELIDRHQQAQARVQQHRQKRQKEVKPPVAEQAPAGQS